MIAAGALGGASKPSGTVTLFGRKISYDALLLAGATLLGVLFAYHLSQSGGGVNLGVQPNPTLPDASGGTSSITSDPGTVISSDAGGTVPASSSDSGYFDNRPSPAKQAPPRSPASGGAAVQWQGILGSGGGDNTTGRSRGSQIFNQDAGAGYGSGGHADSSSSYYGAAVGHLGATVIPNNPPPQQNAQGRNRSSGGQILQ